MERRYGCILRDSTYYVRNPKNLENFGQPTWTDCPAMAVRMSFASAQRWRDKLRAKGWEGIEIEEI